MRTAFAFPPFVAAPPSRAGCGPPPKRVHGTWLDPGG
jgi:hypothetical protein